jgi:hypothetical protein
MMASFDARTLPPRSSQRACKIAVPFNRLRSAR